MKIDGNNAIRNIMVGAILVIYSLVCLYQKKIFYRRFPIEITENKLYIFVAIMMLIGIFFLIKGIRSLLS